MTAEPPPRLPAGARVPNLHHRWQGVGRAPLNRPWTLTVPRDTTRFLTTQEAADMLTAHLGFTEQDAHTLLEARSQGPDEVARPLRGGPRPRDVDTDAEPKLDVDDTGTLAVLDIPGFPPAHLSYRADGFWWVDSRFLPGAARCGAHLRDAARHTLFLYADHDDRIRHDRGVARVDTLRPGDVVMISGALRMVATITPDAEVEESTELFWRLGLLEFDTAVHLRPDRLLETATPAQWRGRWAPELAATGRDERTHIYSRYTLLEELEDLTRGL